MPAVFSSRHWIGYGKGSLVDSGLQSLAGFELGLPGSRNLDGFAGPRIAALGGAAVGHAESPETNQANLATPSQGIPYGVEDTVNGFGGVGLGKAGAAGNGRYKVIFIQLKVPLKLSQNEGMSVRKRYAKSHNRCAV